MSLTEPAPNRDPLHEPSLRRLPIATSQRDRIIAAHERALAANDAGYLDPLTGLFVITAAQHLARGYCCESGCRHCPFVR